ncbi:MAG: Crp/Fnr family transcriptional regulator [Chloroflexi bacterium]|nr:Crp/Fnr family transcriptional regulator [Chloroflexota bacterium]
MALRANRSSAGARRVIKNKVAYLSEVEILRDLSTNELEEWDRSFTMITTPAGKIFYTPEEMGEVLFLLKKGRVQLYRISREGKKLVIDTLGPGTLFGEMALVGQGMHDTFAEAVEDCLLCVMSRADLERLLTKKPAVALRIFELVGQRLMDVEARLEDIAFKSVPARLASLLVRLAKEHGSLITGLTHQDLADTVGTYRETTTQTLNQFKAQGLISIGRKRIEILNLEGLKAIAEG